MKIRKDFVTNSSSSSYICDACGHTESGWDLGLSEAEMVECENGHTVCIDEVDEISFEIKKSYLIKHLENEIKDFNQCIEKDPDRAYYYERVEELKKNLDSVKEADEDAVAGNSELEDLYSDLIEELELIYNYPKELCPICRHEVVMDHEVINYALEQLGITRAELVTATREYLIAEDQKNK